MQLYLVRHPKPLVAPGICYGASDVKCSAKELEAAAAQLTRDLPQGVSIISSPLSRCEHLTQVLCRPEPTSAYITDANLAEMNFGAWEMRAWDAIDPQELKAWTDSFATYRCGGSGESTAMFVRRVAQCLLESVQSGEDQIWITHAGVIRAVQWLFMQPKALLTEMSESQAALTGLLASDWPKGEVAFGRLHRVLRWE